MFIYRKNNCVIIQQGYYNNYITYQGGSKQEITNWRIISHHNLNLIFNGNSYHFNVFRQVIRVVIIILNAFFYFVFIHRIFYNYLFIIYLQ